VPIVQKQAMFSQHCPVCNSSAFIPSGQELELSEILHRWEKEVGVSFPKHVWEEYSFAERHNVTLFQCHDCSFAMFYPPITGSEAFYATVTEKEYYNPVTWEFLQAILDLRQYNCRRVLDIGCGEGDFLDLLSERIPGINCFGYEFHVNAVEKARDKGHAVLSGKFPDCLSESNIDEPFDAITLFQVLEHIPNPIGFIKELKDLLKPEGLLIIGVPNSKGPVRYFHNALTNIPPHHVSWWCAACFRKGMPQLGFEVIKVAYEPLPDYLWESYLTFMWDNIWPSEKYKIKRILNKQPEVHKADQIALFIQTMRKNGEKWIWGIPGHSIYVILRQRDQEKSPNVYQFHTLHSSETELDWQEDWISRWEESISSRELELHQQELLLRERVQELEQIETLLNQKAEELSKRESQYNSLRIVRIARRIKKILTHG
jgi:SAM-dependent methyltransferase